MKQVTFYIITGGPGVGKTSLAEKLSNAGYGVIAEDARRIIKQQVDAGGEALPWKNKAQYLQLMLAASIESYLKAVSEKPDAITFFDRGIPDSLCYATMNGLDLSASITKTAEDLRYNQTVFILPPWPEIYQTDAERKQNWEEAESTYHAMKRTYETQCYNVIEVPKIAVEERKLFILSHIKG